MKFIKNFPDAEKFRTDFFISERIFKKWKLKLKKIAPDVDYV